MHSKKETPGRRAHACRGHTHGTTLKNVYHDVSGSSKLLQPIRSLQESMKPLSMVFDGGEQHKAPQADRAEAPATYRLFFSRKCLLPHSRQAHH